MPPVIAKIIQMISKHDKIAIFHHNNIDGDSLSCSYGLLLALKEKWPAKKIVWIVNEAEMAKNFPFFTYDKKVVKTSIDNSYLAIIGDTAAEKQVFNYPELIKATKIICFDHHQNDINIKHDLFWSEPNYSASALQAIEIIEHLDIKLNEEIALALMIGIITDTGNFAYSLNDPKPPQYFAKLLTHISQAKMDWWWNNFRARTLNDIEITKVFYENLKFKEHVAYVVFDQKLSKRFQDVNFKIKISNIANIVGYPIWCLFVYEDDILKIHLRSNGPDVSKLAITYGGGGHIRAAGAKVAKDKIAIDKIVTSLNEIAAKYQKAKK